MPSSGAGAGDGDAALSIDAEILTSVRALGRYPVIHRTPQKEEDVDERKLYRKIEWHWYQLAKKTIAELEKLRAPRQCGFLREVVSKRTELRKLKAPRALHDMVTLLAQPRPLSELQQGCASEWWKSCGARRQARAPNSCRERGKEKKMPAIVCQYDLSHGLLLEINAFLGGEPPPQGAAGTKLTYSEFYARCGSKSRVCDDAGGRVVMTPFPARLADQRGFGVFHPHQCLRQLALIIAEHKQYTELPLDHGALLEEVRQCIENESVQCTVFSELHEAAVQRLIEYSQDSSRCFANLRFLDLHETVKETAAGSGAHPAGRRPKVETELATQAALRRMVETLAEALEQQSVNMNIFTPNQFAAMSVYFSKFVAKRSGREGKAKNGLARWCFGLPAFVPGEAIEPESLRRPCLASQCLPRNYASCDGPEVGAVERSCQAIAAAPVTCELCHMGFAGHDKLQQHCSMKHGGYAEYRKRTFYKAREAGLSPLLPWVKRNMAQSFQFFRLHSVPGSVNDWTMKATKEAVARREEACVVCAVKDWLENRYKVCLFKQSSATSTWGRYFYGSQGDDVCEEEDVSARDPRSGTHSLGGSLLVDECGVFCFGPKEQVHALLDVRRYATE